MKKYSVLGIGNINGLNHIIVPKKQAFFVWFSTLISVLGQVSPNVSTHEGPPPDYLMVKKKISEMTDTHEYYDVTNEHEQDADLIRFEVFYGKEKIFITFYCNNNLREKFMKTFMKTSEFVK